MLIEASESVLLIVDVQDRLAPAVAGAEGVIAQCSRLVEAAHRLAIPVVVSEQYPKGLGGTVAPLAEKLQPASVISKTAFASSREGNIEQALAASGRRTIVVCGMEAHVCVLQTALDLLSKGFVSAVVADACGSRNPEHKALALERMRANGVEIVVAEMVLFEWLGCAGTPEFKALSPLIR